MSNVNEGPNDTFASKVPTLCDLFGSDATKDSETQMQIMEPGTHPPAIENNLKRCARLMEAENILAELEMKAKKQKLDVEAKQKEQRKIQTLTSLRLVGRASAWESLDYEERWEKETILAILSCKSNKNNLPYALSEHKWNQYMRRDRSNRKWKEKYQLCQDLDIFLARLRRPEFKTLNGAWGKTQWLKLFGKETLLQYHSKHHQNWEHTATNLSSIVELFPEVFPMIFYSEKCDLKDVAKAYLRACTQSFAKTWKKRDFLRLLSNNLLKDEDLMILVLRTFPFIKDIPKQLTGSCSFALALAKEIFLSEKRLLRLFSKFTSRVQADPTVAKAFCEVDSSLYVDLPFRLRRKSSEVAAVASKGEPTLLLSFVPGKIQLDLTSNKAFILSLFNKSGVLKKLPWEIRYQFHLILSPTLKKDPDVVLAAVKSRILHVDQVPPFLKPSVKGALKKSPSFVMDALRQHSSKLENRLEPPPRDEELAIAFRAIEEDRTLAMTALVEGLVPIESPLPLCWACDPNFWKEAMQQEHSIWDFCPFVDVGFAKGLESPGPELMEHILNSFPHLSSDLDLWREFLKEEEMEIDDLESYLEEYAAPSVLRDKDTMLLAIAHDSWVYGILPTTLQSDGHILEAMIAMENESLFMHMPMETRVAYPHIVAQALEFVVDLDDVYEMLEPNEWSNRQILRTWFSRGGWWIEEAPDDIREDEELMLLIAENQPGSFHGSSPELLGKKEFILRVLDKNGMLYRIVLSESLKHDFDVVLTAWSTSEEVGDIFLEREEYRFVAEFAFKVRTKLSVHEIFFKTILCGTSAKGTSSSPLKHLLFGLGLETSLSFRKQLAELLDIPTGVELRRLRKASEHLELWGY